MQAPQSRGWPQLSTPDGDQGQRRVARFLEIQAGVVFERRQPVDDGVPVAGEPFRRCLLYTSDAAENREV